jgi:hypothetical protein
MFVRTHDKIHEAALFLSSLISPSLQYERAPKLYLNVSRLEASRLVSL